MHGECQVQFVVFCSFHWFFLQKKSKALPCSIGVLLPSAQYTYCSDQESEDSRLASMMCRWRRSLASIGSLLGSCSVLTAATALSSWTAVTSECRATSSCCRWTFSAKCPRTDWQVLARISRDCVAAEGVLLWKCCMCAVSIRLHSETTVLCTSALCSTFMSVSRRLSTVASSAVGHLVLFWVASSHILALLYLLLNQKLSVLVWY